MKKIFPFIFLFLTTLAIFFPAIFQDKIIMPADFLVSWYKPWKDNFAIPIKNPAIPDVVTQIYPWKKITIDALKEGRLPWWNPYSFSGTPHLANFQSQVLYPLNLFFLVLPMSTAWNILIISQPLLAGLFTYLFCRKIQLSKTAGLISSLSFSFGGAMTTWLSYGTIGHSLLWLPAILWSIEHFLTDKSRRRFLFYILNSIFYVLSFFAGHPQTFIYVYLASTLYFFFRSYQINGGFRWRSFVFYILNSIFFILIASPQWLPSLQLLLHSPRAIFNSANVDIRYLATFLAPDFFGNPVTRNVYFGNYNEWMGYIGVISFVLAIIAIVETLRHNIATSIRPYCKIFLFLSVFYILTSLFLPFPFGGKACRAISIVSFSLSILAGLGWDSLSTIKNKYKILIFFAFVYFCLASFAVFNHNSVALRNLIFPSALFFPFSIFYFISSKISNSHRVETQHAASLHQHIFSILVLLLIAIDLARFSGKWQPFSDKKYLYPSTPTIEFLQKNLGEYRLWGVIGQETSNYFGLQNVYGYDPLNIKNYGLYLSTSKYPEGKILDPAVYTLDPQGLQTPRLLNELSVKYLILDARDKNQVWSFPYEKYSKNYPLIFKDVFLEVRENLTVLPKARLNEGRANIIKYLPGYIEITTETENPSILILADVYYPQWHAYVDNQEVPLELNNIFRKIEVPVGRHTVVFRYENRYL